jgi:hypothetical protein
VDHANHGRRAPEPTSQIESADVIMLNQRLSAVLDAYEVSQYSYRKIVQNVFLAFLFNGLGIPAAATGLVYPVWGMLAMAASVTAIFINSLWGQSAADRVQSAGLRRMSTPTDCGDVTTVTDVVYCGPRMKLSLVRLVATLLLSGQMLPAGLPLLCDQVQRGTSANCEQQMASHPSGRAVDATSHGALCANSAFCATVATAVIAPSGAVSVSLGESHMVGFGTSTFAPADPQAPLPPPPQA